jgi:hypothetical protein
MIFLRIRRRLGVVAALCIGLAGPAVQSHGAPAGPVVLTIALSEQAKAEFDMAAIEKLPQHSFKTTTPWHAQARTFTGPLLRDLLAAAGAKGTALRAVALNGYKTDIPFEDAAKYDVIVARLLDGKPMAVRERGPLFIVYPFDSRSELRAERFYSRSAWQLRTLEVK